MRVTVIRPDNLVLVDGRAETVDCSQVRAEVRVVQWNSDKSLGHIEFDNAEANAWSARGNEEIKDFSEFTPLLKVWEEVARKADAKLAEVRRQLEEEAKAMPQL